MRANPPLAAHYSTIADTAFCRGSLGLAQGKSEAHAIAIIHQALELGVNLFDTAAAYGTEPVLGKAIKAARHEDVVITTKAPFSFNNPRATAKGIVASLDNSLRQLDTDYIDVYQLHGVPPSAYQQALNDLTSVLLKEKAKGKFRHLGITETAPHDLEHEVVRRAAQDGVWDVVIVGFHMMHQNAREPRVSADTGEPGRYIADVRRTQHLLATGALPEHDARPGGGRRGSAVAR
jgi:aryl-alcohol dehydrogenase-like predicted oxidoreductase